MMKSLDDGVGNIIKALDDEQLSNRTIVIFTNDNGGARYSENGGLTRGNTQMPAGVFDRTQAMLT